MAVFQARAYHVKLDKYHIEHPIVFRYPRAYPHHIPIIVPSEIPMIDRNSPIIKLVVWWHIPVSSIDIDHPFP